MPAIKFQAIFGDDERTVSLQQPSGSGGFYQIMIGNYYHGQIVYQAGQWRVHLASKSELNSDDCAILVEIVDQAEKVKAK